MAARRSSHVHSSNPAATQLNSGVGQPTRIVRMHVIDFGPDRAAPVTEYASRGASAQPLADGAGEAHVYAVYLAAGGEIGPHPAGFGQLFLVVAGEGWVAGDDGARRRVRAGQGVVIARGEVHAKGSEAGCTAVMIQLAELAPAADLPGGRR